MSTLKLTLEQVKESIAKNEQKTVYYSTGNLWWTHDPNDLQESTKLGNEMQEEKNQRFLNDPNQSPEAKSRLSSLLNGLKEHQAKFNTNTPLDPWGCPLTMMDLKKWISAAEEKPDHFGKYKLEAFMKAHHKNCSTIYKYAPFGSWNHVTDMLDGYYSITKK